MVTHHLAKVAYTSSNLACCFFYALLRPLRTDPQGFYFLFGSSLTMYSFLSRYLMASTAALAAEVVVV